MLPLPPQQPSLLDQYVYVQANPATFVDPSGLVTAGICITAIVGIPGAYVTVSVCPLTVASNGDVGVQASAGGGGTTGFIGGVSIGPQVSTGNSVSDLKGPFVTAGGSFRLGQGAGIDVFGGTNDQGSPVIGGS